MDFVIADTHFGHSNIIKHCNRPFRDAHEMDEHMIRLWNETVKPGDRVFHLGDFQMMKIKRENPEESQSKTLKDRTRAILERLNGYKILVPGNHDNHHGVNWWKSVGFNEVYEKDQSLVYEDRYLFSHRPIIEPKYFNIHGHIHNTRLPDVMGNMFFCVSVEMIDYRPIAIAKIDEILKK